LSEIFEELGIEVGARKRMINTLSKEGFNSSKYLSESLDKGMQTLDCILGKEAGNFHAKDKLNIMRWLKDNRSA